MKLLAIVVVLVAAASYPTLGAEISQVECQSYQETLKKAIRIREKCDLPAFSDCCQPKSLFPTTSTGIYETSDICSHGTRAFLQEPPGKMNVRCDMDINGGGWLVIQRRVSGGTVNFTQNWDAYEQGFGDLEDEFWFGLLNIHCLTTREEVELRIDMQNTHGANITWTYQQFQVDGPEDDYRLHIGQGEGTTGTVNAMAYHNNYPFSTYDCDNDANRINCALNRKGGWWYNSCHHTSPNSPHGHDNFIWFLNRLLYVEMKVRPKTCTLAISKQCD